MRQSQTTGVAPSVDTILQRLRSVYTPAQLEAIVESPEVVIRALAQEKQKEKDEKRTMELSEAEYCIKFPGSPQGMYYSQVKLYLVSFYNSMKANFRDVFSYGEIVIRPSIDDLTREAVFRVEKHESAGYIEDYRIKKDNIKFTKRIAGELATNDSMAFATGAIFGSPREHVPLRHMLEIIGALRSAGLASSPPTTKLPPPPPDAPEAWRHAFRKMTSVQQPPLAPPTTSSAAAAVSSTSERAREVETARAIEAERARAIRAREDDERAAAAAQALEGWRRLEPLGDLIRASSAGGGGDNPHASVASGASVPSYRAQERPPANPSVVTTRSAAPSTAATRPGTATNLSSTGTGYLGDPPPYFRRG